VQYFRLSLGGRVTPNIPAYVSATGLEAILQDMFNGQLDVVVTKSSVAVAGGARTYTWDVQFLTMLNVWQSMPDTGPATGRQLSLVAPASSAEPLTLYQGMSITRAPAARGVYPMSFTLWRTGAYLVHIQRYTPLCPHHTLCDTWTRTRLTPLLCFVLDSNGVDIAGSPLTIQVANAPLDASASYAVSGAGLLGGVAGVQEAIVVQAQDTHAREVPHTTKQQLLPRPSPIILPRLTLVPCVRCLGQVQYVSTSAVVQPYVAETQYISISADPNQNGWTFSLTFRGYTLTGVPPSATGIQVYPFRTLRITQRAASF